MSAQDQRDRWEAALKRSLERAARSPAGECPGAAILAALFDGHLDAGEARRWEPHIAGCARCQEQLAVLVRTQPAGEPPAGRPAGAWWGLSPGSWRWLAPAAAALGVVALLVAIRPDGGDIATAPAPRPAETTAAVAPSEPQADALAAKTPARTPAEAAKGPAAGEEQPARPARTAPPAEEPMRARKEDVVAVARAQEALKPEPAGAARLEARDEIAALEARRADEQAVAPAAPAPVPAIARAAVVVERPVVVKVPPAPLSRARAPRAEGLAAESAPQTMWRIGAEGRIEKSADAGRTWEAQKSPTGRDLLTGACVSDTVCWLAGRGGVVLRTTDGMTWELVAAPAETDLTAVAAQDERRAVVTSADGRRFATEDGGKSWRPL